MRKKRTDIRRSVGPFAFCALFLFASPVFAAADVSPDCKSVIITAPPVTENVETSNALAKRTEAEVVKHFQLPCLEKAFVRRGVSREYFDYLGRNAFFRRDVGGLSERAVAFLYEYTHATHIVEPTWYPKARRLIVRIFKISDTFELLGPVRFSLTIPAETMRKMPMSPRVVNFLALMTPNTFTFGEVDTEVVGFSEDAKTNGYKVAETRQRSMLPKIISSIGLNKIDHQAGYGHWDYSGSFFPGLYLYAIDQETVFTKVNEQDLTVEERVAKIELYGACTNFNVMASGHTPAGTTYAGIGFGPCLSQSRNDGKSANFYGDAAFRIFMGHRVFLARRSYLFFEVDMLMFQRKLYKNESTDTNQVQRGSFGYGYYLPDVEYLYARAAEKVADF